jgi:hypothetical protein
VDSSTCSMYICMHICMHAHGSHAARMYVCMYHVPGITKTRRAWAYACIYVCMYQIPGRTKTGPKSCGSEVDLLVLQNRMMLGYDISVSTHTHSRVYMYKCKHTNKRKWGQSPCAAKHNDVSIRYICGHAHTRTRVQDTYHAVCEWSISVTI